MEHNFDSLNLEVYYSKLSKKDKSKYLKYLMINYDLNYSTIRRKLSGAKGCNLNTLERIACKDAIEKEEEWRH